MRFPPQVQLISRKASEQYYINFPSAVAQAMEFAPDEPFVVALDDTVVRKTGP